VFAVNKFINYNVYPNKNTFKEMSKVDFIIGTYFGGTIYSVNLFSRTFYQLHDQKLARNQFVGKDQTLYNWIVTNHPKKFFVVCSCLQVPWTTECGDVWFYFLLWYSEIGQYWNGPCNITSNLRNMTDFLQQFANAT
jgi:hypothetical protein